MHVRCARGCVRAVRVGASGGVLVGDAPFASGNVVSSQATFVRSGNVVVSPCSICANRSSIWVVPRKNHTIGPAWFSRSHSTRSEWLFSAAMRKALPQSGTVTKDSSESSCTWSRSPFLTALRNSSRPSGSSIWVPAALGERVRVRLSVCVCAYVCACVPEGGREGGKKAGR